MSYDLAVWYSSTSLTPDKAHAIYKQLYRGNDNILNENERIKLFLQELVLTYPNLDNLPDEELHNSPWDVNIDINYKYVLLHIKWPRAEEVIGFIEQLALKHYLVFYNPQTQKLALPEHLIKRPQRKKSWWRLIFG